MKNLKKILSLVLCLMMAAVLLTSCSKSLKGTWELVDAADESFIREMKAEDGGLTLKFTKDEITMTVKGGDDSESDTAEYKVEDGKIVIVGEDVEWEYKIKGNKLTVFMWGEELIFKRK